MSASVVIRLNSIDLTVEDRTVVVSQSSSEIVAVGASGPQGPAGATGVVAAGAPITYNAGTQTVGIALGTGLTTTGGTVNVTKVVATADSAVTALETKPTGETYPRAQIAASGKIWSQPSKFAPFTGRHNTTNVGYGTDTQVYIERSDLTSSLVTLRMNRFQAITGAEATVTSGSFPMTNGTAVLADASAFPNAAGGGVLYYEQLNDPLTTPGSLSASWTNRTPFASPTAAFAVGATGAYCTNLHSPSIATVSAGEVNHDVQCKLSGTLADNMGIVVRFNQNLDGSAAWVSIRYNTATAKVDTYAHFRSTAGALTATYLGTTSGFFVSGMFLRAIVDGVRLAVYLGQVDDQGEIQYETPEIYTLTDARSLVGTNAGLWRNSAANTTALYSNFSVRAAKSFSYTGKSGLSLTGVTCSTSKTFTADAATFMSYTDISPVNLVAGVDSNGAVIWRLKNLGGQHTTDNITMGRNDDGGDVGLMFQSDTARTDSGLVFLGDSAPTGTSGASGNRGTFIRRVAARLLRVGGRMHIAPSDISNYDGAATGNGTATAPHLGIGNVDTGLYLTTAAGVDTLNVSADGANVATFGASGATVTGQAVVLTNDARLTNARTPTAHAFTHASGGSDAITVAPSQVTGTAVITTDSRLDAATKLVANTTTTQVVSTTAKTAFLTQSIGPVTANDVYLLTAFGDLRQQAGTTESYTLELALGSTTLGTSQPLAFATNATRRKWHIELRLICGTTSAQTIGGLLTIGGLSSTVTLPLTAPVASAPLTYTATEDMSSAKNLIWSVSMTANSANMDWRTLGYTLQRLR